MDRRKFLTSTAASAAGLGFFTSCSSENSTPAGSASPFTISLAQWSLHNALKEGKLDNLDYPAYTKNNFQIDGVEWVNQFFGEKDDKLGLQPKGGDYIAQMRKRCEDNGVQSVLIMCDRVGSLGDSDAAKRTAAVEGHYAWCDAAKELGCHSIRVNAASNASLSAEEQAALCADGLSRLAEFGKKHGLNVIVENHGGLSSNGAWLSSVLKSVNLPNCGSLPDFGNFYVERKRPNTEEAAWQKTIAAYEGNKQYVIDETGVGYDRYLGVKELMPFAKGVSAKTHDFDAEGNETHTDYLKIMKIVKDSGYQGRVGIEYEGKDLSEDEGIKKTKALLERVFAQL